MTGLAVGSAVALGLMTSVYPCTMATNLTALSWLASSSHSVRRTILAGLLYALGRAFTYTGLGLLLSWLALSHVRVADTLQHYAQQLLGPFLILTGMFVSRLLFSGSNIIPARFLDRVHKSRYQGMPAAFAMGAVLALAFCPASAALFFGSVVTNLATNALSPVLLPAAYGLGTALPVVITSVVFARGLAALQKRLYAARWFTRQLPAVSGGLLILLGLYLSIRDIILS